MLLSELFSKAGVQPDRILGDAEFTTLVMDSRKATPGCCFVAMPSESGDSHRFLSSAREAGAVAAIVHSREGLESAVRLGLASAFVEPGVRPPARGRGWEIANWAAAHPHEKPSEWDSLKLEEYAEYFAAQDELEFEAKMNSIPETPERRVRRTSGGFSEAIWRLAKVAFGDPSSKLKVIGVTGTNGKTTTSWLIRDMLNLLGIPCAYIGTLGFGLPGAGRIHPDDGRRMNSALPGEELRPLANTTPFSIELNAMLAECVERGCQAVAMEVSSHALAERRVDGIEFDVAVFTNLSQDHLDYHGTMEAYEAAKWRLFSELPHGSPDETEVCGKTWFAVNAEDRMGAALLQANSYLYCIPFGRTPDTLWLIHSRVELAEVFLELDYHGLDCEGCAPLGGAYNVWNVHAALAAIHALSSATGTPSGGFPEACKLMWAVRPVPGRFEPVPNESGIGIIVDYAHTPDALEKLLATARPLTKGRLITVFGCGGDRDKSKRPLMAKAAQAGSDIVVVTSDNPRTEDPLAIIEDIRQGFDDPALELQIEPDRPKAVALAIRLAEPGDTVIIAGKGHEDYQIIGREKIHMDDRELARDGLLARASSPNSGETR